MSYLKEISAEVTLNIDTSEITYLSEPPVYIPNLNKGTALMYGGTQFGEYEALGDGRSVVLKNTAIKDGVFIAKGGLTTPYSKFGDGYYSIESANYERDVAGRLKQLGIATQETIAIYKQKKGVTAIIDRQCPYRIGTFEYVSRNHPDKLEKLWSHLTNYARPTMGLHWTPAQLFSAIVRRYGELYSQWHQVGFIHGCLNTDNMAALPFGIDYGHSIFSYDNKAQSKIDINGRYSRENQQNAMLYGLNKYRLALESLLQHYSADMLYADFIAGAEQSRLKDD